jgi:hypothetical protein
VMASFPDHEVELIAERLDSPRDLALESYGTWVYRRSEDSHGSSKEVDSQSH